jgi:hypothetical protein
MAIWTDPATRIDGSGRLDDRFCARQWCAAAQQLEPVPHACHAVRAPVVRRGVSKLSGVHVAWSHACITPWAVWDRSYVRCQ